MSAGIWRKPIDFRMLKPVWGCLRISSHSDGVERPGLEQDGVGHANLADVVQERPAEDVVELGVAGEQRLAVQPGEDVLGPVVEVADAGREAVGVHGDPQHVDRRLEQGRVDPLDQDEGGRVGC